MVEESYELSEKNKSNIKDVQFQSPNLFSKFKHLFSKTKIKESPPRKIYIKGTQLPQNISTETYYKLFMNNNISTAKYHLFTCLPKFLYEQFSNYANIFFLFTSCIQQIDGITPTSRYTTAVPLFCVLVFTAIKEGLEDYKRHKSDNETNNRQVKILDKNSFKEYKWMDIRVGDIVRIENGEYFPADLILVSSSEPEGVCYIETSNLDGETNLKVKQSISETNHLTSPESISTLRGYVNSEGPNDSLYTYSGTLNLENQSELSLSANQILLRGAMLRNTNWIYGVVVFTGHETKLMRNATSAPIKRTNIVKRTNVQIAFLFAILLILAIFCATSSIYIQNYQSGFLTHIRYKTKTGFTFSDWLRNSLTFLILFNNLIPISLIVTMEVVKFQQAELINNDLDIYYEESDTPALCRTSSLVEELGQIDYIFSDKTGTLTCNVMDFKECTINGVQYSSTKIGNKKDFSELKIEALNDSSFCKEFLLILSICHTVIPEIDNNEIVYQASSPDEGALVKGASLLGYTFYQRKPKSVSIKICEKNIEEEWEILNICEFNSTRKRMSVICKSPLGEIKLFCKGADNVILERLGKNENPNLVDITLNQLEEYAKIGLRTLCLSSKTIGLDEYQIWKNKYDIANASLNDRQDKLDEVAELIEKDMNLIGATAIEDKLQDGVPETIYTLAQAGIKIWVLTGDRQETAINIGHSCKLIQEDMEVWIFNEETILGCKGFLIEKLKEIDQMETLDVVLVIDGSTLDFCLGPELETDLYNLATKCKAVICCRVSPLQKALVVKMVKKRSKAILLAIGDGANDVSMIQAAHVGVGINGQEGLQAARSSDFAISQFRFLKKLLLVHGAWSYNRLSKLILFSFYKNICLYMTQFWFSFENGFSGQTLYESWTNTFYNVLFTVMPPLMIGICDQHLSVRSLDNYPELYKIGQKNQLFNVKTFWGSTINAIFHSLLIFFLVSYSYRGDILLPNGWTGNYADFSLTIYSSVLVTVLLKAILITNHWTKYTIYAVPGSLLIWFIYIPVYSTITSYFGHSPEYSGILYALLSTPLFWFMIIILPIICLLRDYIWKFGYRTYKPRSYHVVQEIQKYNIPDYRPQMERFKKAVDKVVSIQRMKSDRGYAFSQNEFGLADLMSRYDTTKSKPSG